ncbi:MAG: putative RDD family membrane protein YckC, partial [Ulvibacter sp.]
MSYNINNLDKYKIIPERITAYLVDFLILTPILAISIVMFATTSSVIIMNIWSFVSFFLIFSFFTFFIFLYGQTPGKMLMNIITLSGDGRLPSLQQSILRSAAYFITSIPLLKMADIIFIVLNN